MNKPYYVLYDSGELNICFSNYVYADGFFCQCNDLQKWFEDGLFEEEKITKIKIDCSQTVWFDTLAMCYLLLFADVAFNKGIEVIYIIISSYENTDKNKFIAFLDDNGFLEQMKKSGNLICQEVPEMNYSDVHKCIWPLQIIHNCDITNNMIENSIGMIKHILQKELQDELSSSELEYTINKVSYFLQETLDNVYKHAYPTNNFSSMSPCNPCALLIKRIRSVDFKKYNIQYTKKTPYINISLYEEKDSYLEIYVADTGIGIRQSFLEDPDGKDANITDENIIGYILSNGKRSHKKTHSAETTRFGGLFDIVSMFKDDGDKLGIKGDSRWFFTPSNRDMVSRINPDIAQNEYKNLLHGFAIVGSISWKNPTANNYPFKDELKNHYKSYVKPLFLDKNPWMKKGYCDDKIVIDNRFTDKVIIKNGNNIAVLFPPHFLTKNNIVDMLQECESKTIIIAGVPEGEYKKYETMLMRLNIEHPNYNFDKCILISNTLLPKVYVCETIKNSSWKKGLVFSKSQTQKYISFVNDDSISLSFLSFLLWKKVFDSERIWELVSKYNSQSYINAQVEWKDINIRGYLDFSQVCLIKECRSLCLEWLFGFDLITEKLYFNSLDRFTDSICEQANHNMNNELDSNEIWIGSVFVSGTSARNFSSHCNSDNTFYFFRHADSTNREKNVYAIFEWATNVFRINEWFNSTDADKNYKRVGNSSFVADNGHKYWINKHFTNWESAYQLKQTEIYKVLQQQYGARPSVLKVGHMNCEDHHDLFEVNMDSLFYTDMITSKFANQYQNTSYDYLLIKFIEALLFHPKSSTIKNYLYNTLTTTQMQSICNKFYEYRKKCNYKKPVEKHGLVVYLNDYQTSKIVDNLKQVFSDEMCSRIIPIIPIEKEYVSSTLMVSPLLLDKIQKSIWEIKEYNKTNYKDDSVSVTIFISTSFTTRLHEELKHILLCMGATQVIMLSLLDRQRIPFGIAPTTNNQAYCRLDLPSIGFSKNCPLCDSIENLLKLKNYMRDISVCSRLDSVVSQWKAVKGSENHFNTGISMEYLDLPNEILQEIDTYNQMYSNNNIKISTNLGLALFAIENTSFSLSTDFLDKCINSICLNDGVKILLICTHLLVFNHLQISEKHKCELLKKLCDILINIDIVDENETDFKTITSLAVVTICSQTEPLKRYTLQYLIEQDNNCCTSKSIDYLLIQLMLYNEFQKNNMVNIPNSFKLSLNCYFKSSKSKLDILYDEFLYVEPEYIQSHRQAFSQILHTNNALPLSIYKKSVEFLDKLYEIYNQNLLLDLFHSPENYNNQHKEILKDLFDLQNTINSVSKKTNVGVCEHEEIKGMLKKLLKKLQKINEDLYLRVGNDMGINNWLETCELLAQERTNKNDTILKSIGKYTSTLNYSSSPDVRPWFYAFGDVTEEVINIMSDMMRGRSRKLYNFIQMDNNPDELFDGLISVEYTEYYTEISFYNITQNDKSIEEIRKIKISKRNRPSTIIFDSFEKRLSELTGNKVACFEWNYAEENFDLKLEDGEHLFQAILRIPYIDMGSSFTADY